MAYQDTDTSVHSPVEGEMINTTDSRIVSQLRQQALSVAHNSGKQVNWGIVAYLTFSPGLMVHVQDERLMPLK